MGCTYYSAGEELQLVGEANRKLKLELDKSTRLLCAVLTKLEDTKYFDTIEDQELLEWWSTHKEMDKARIEAETKRALAQAELDMKRKAKEEKSEKALMLKLMKKYKKK